jgi:hypothetical protein
MCYLTPIFAFVFLFSCKPKQTALVKNSNITISSDCPENGTCHFEVFQNAKLEQLKDNQGALYVNITEGDMLVLKFEYVKNKTPNTSDSSYREEVFIELDPNYIKKDISNFKGENILFARWCFCKGQTGYYKIRKGHLSVKKLNKESYQLDLDFKVEEVPQMITSIHQIFTLK